MSFLVVCVCVAVDLNRQYPRWAVEISDVRAKRVLAPELETGDLLGTKVSPEDALRRGRIPA